MILQLYAVQDAKAGAFMPPFLARAKGEAIRSFQSACQDEKHQFFAHRGDYALYCVGEWDDVQGVIVPMRLPDRVIGGDEF